MFRNLINTSNFKIWIVGYGFWQEGWHIIFHYHPSLKEFRHNREYWSILKLLNYCIATLIKKSDTLEII